MPEKVLDRCLYSRQKHPYNSGLMRYKEPILILEGALVEMCSTLSAFCSKNIKIARLAEEKDLDNYIRFRIFATESFLKLPQITIGDYL